MLVYVKVDSQRSGFRILGGQGIFYVEKVSILFEISYRGGLVWLSFNLEGEMFPQKKVITKSRWYYIEEIS